MMSLKFIHIVACGRMSFLFKNWVIFHCMYIPRFVYPFIHQWTFGLLPVLAFVHNAVMNMGVQISFWERTFNSFGSIPKCGITGSYGKSIFNFLRNHYTAFHSGYTILHLHQQCTRVPISPQAHKHLLFSSFGFRTAILSASPKC